MIEVGQLRWFEYVMIMEGVIIVKEPMKYEPKNRSRGGRISSEDVSESSRDEREDGDK